MIIQIEKNKELSEVERCVLIEVLNDDDATITTSHTCGKYIDFITEEKKDE